jgi:hypothetical protein
MHKGPVAKAYDVFLLQMSVNHSKVENPSLGF